MSNGLKALPAFIGRSALIQERNGKEMAARGKDWTGSNEYREYQDAQFSVMLTLPTAANALHWRIAFFLLSIIISALAAAQSSAHCKLDDRFPDIRGKWIKTRDVARIGGYDEATCPEYIHLTDCMRQSKDRPKTLEEYRYRFESDGCRLPAFNARQASNCLSNRRLILIGDSLTWSQFESLACMLSSVAVSSQSYMLFDAQHFHKFEDSKYRGDIGLPNNASVHMRGMNKFDMNRWEAWVSELGGLRSEDVLVVNFGAHYTEGAAEDYQRTMREIILGVLRQSPCTVFWREYSPVHFGGPSGKFFHNITINACVPAAVGETGYNQYTMSILEKCGAACAHIKWLPVFGPSLGRHGSHTGDHISEKARGYWIRALHHDCRHFCLNVVDLWNQVLLGMMCRPASALA